MEKKPLKFSNTPLAFLLVSQREREVMKDERIHYGAMDKSQA